VCSFIGFLQPELQGEPVDFVFDSVLPSVSGVSMWRTRRAAIEALSDIAISFPRFSNRIVEWIMNASYEDPVSKVRSQACIAVINPYLEEEERI
jgi:hypothetical protein